MALPLMLAFAGAQAGMSILGGFAEKKGLKHQEDLLKTRYGLNRIRLEKRRKEAVGDYIAKMGGSGVEPSLRRMNRINTEFYMDEIIARENLEQNEAMIDIKGKQAIFGGFASAAMAGMGAFAGRSKPLPVSGMKTMFGTNKQFPPNTWGNIGGKE
jgi:hypothetical protein